MPDFPIVLHGQKQPQHDIHTWTLNIWASLGLRQADRKLWERYCSILNITKLPTPPVDATTTAWTRYGGTSNGWAILSTQVILLDPT